jgi:hypothetical protein
VFVPFAMDIPPFVKPARMIHRTRLNDNQRQSGRHHKRQQREENKLYDDKSQDQRNQPRLPAVFLQELPKPTENVSFLLSLRIFPIIPAHFYQKKVVFLKDSNRISANRAFRAAALDEESSHPRQVFSGLNKPSHSQHSRYGHFPIQAGQPIYH